MPKCLVLSLCAVLLLAGCAPVNPLFSPLPTPVPGTALPFEVVMRETQGRYTGAPALYIVTSLEATQGVADLIEDPVEKATLQAQYPNETFSSTVGRDQFLKRAQQLKAGQVLLALFNPPHEAAAGATMKVHRVLLQGNALYVYAARCHYQVGPAVVVGEYQIVQVTLPAEAPPAADLTPVLVTYDMNC